ncbi:hypothetical protein [Caudoviricetes sp.]|nr:hypothetical protein [Caudoviricetes sp.]
MDKPVEMCTTSVSSGNQTQQTPRLTWADST